MPTPGDVSDELVGFLFQSLFSWMKVADLAWMSLIDARPLVFQSLFSWMKVADSSPLRNRPPPLPPVSILVLLDEGCRLHRPRFSLPRSNQVSILVLLDEGCRLHRYQAGVDRLNGFQSLFSWMKVADQKKVIRTKVMRASFNPCSLG